MSAMGILRRNAFNVERQSAGLVFAGLKLLTKGLQLTIKARSYITADTPVHFDALFTLQLRLKEVKR